MGTPVRERTTKIGRKPKLTKELIEDIEALFIMGATDKAVFMAMGIGKTAYYGWLKKGEESERKNIFTDLVETVNRAKGMAYVSYLNDLQEQSENRDHKATMAWLRKHHPDEWGDIVDAPEGVNINVKALTFVEVLNIGSDEAKELARDIARIEARRRQLQLKSGDSPADGPSSVGADQTGI
jgi:hypothetical protein